MAGGGGEQGRWLMSYADLVTLLMAFFVALYGISKADTQKFNEFLGGLGPFGNPLASGTGVFDGGPGIVGSGGAIAKLVGTAKGFSGAGVVGPGGHVRTATQEDLPDIQAKIEKSLESHGFKGAATFERDERGLVTTIATDKVLFETGSTKIAERGREIIASIAPALQQLTNEVLIEGHTDNVPLSRAGYSNWNLSTDRAVAVVALLQSVFGVDPGRLSATGYGEYQPKESNATPDGRDANRRVELVIVAEPEKKKDSPQTLGNIAPDLTEGTGNLTDHTSTEGHHDG